MLFEMQRKEIIAYIEMCTDMCTDNGCNLNVIKNRIKITLSHISVLSTKAIVFFDEFSSIICRL